MQEKQFNKTDAERYFYHSFPQFGVDDPDLERKNGLVILESIVRNGLLLTPETIEWSESLTLKSGGTSRSDPWCVSQKRCCFTELFPHELSDHSRRYGHFALEFEIEILRQLGGMPVFYIPRSSENSLGLEGLGEMLIARLGEIQGVLERLAKLEDDVKNNTNKNDLISVEQDGQGVGSIQCTIGGAEVLFALLRLRSENTYTQPTKTLLNAVKGMAGLFAPADDIDCRELLSYYREREWRILAKIEKDGKALTRDLDKSEKEMLLKLNRDFFEEEIKIRGKNHKRVDQCDIYPELNGKPIIQYVHRVIVPNDAVADEVSSLLETIENPPEVLAIESLSLTASGLGECS